MNAARFFQQTAAWEKLTGSDPYEGDTFDAAQDISVRWYTSNDLVRDAQGNEVVSSGRISTTTEVSVGDKVTDEMSRERRVVTVRKNRDTRGKFSHYVAHLK